MNSSNATKNLSENYYDFDTLKNVIKWTWKQFIVARWTTINIHSIQDIDWKPVSPYPDNITIKLKAWDILDYWHQLSKHEWLTNWVALSVNWLEFIRISYSDLQDILVLKLSADEDIDLAKYSYLNTKQWMQELIKQKNNEDNEAICLSLFEFWVNALELLDFNNLEGILDRILFYQDILTDKLITNKQTEKVVHYFNMHNYYAQENIGANFDETNSVNVARYIIGQFLEWINDEKKNNFIKSWIADRKDKYSSWLGDGDFLL